MISRYLYENIHDSKITGIDSSEESIKFANSVSGKSFLADINAPLSENARESLKILNMLWGNVAKKSGAKDMDIYLDLCDPGLKTKYSIKQIIADSIPIWFSKDIEKKGELNALL